MRWSRALVAFLALTFSPAVLPARELPTLDLQMPRPGDRIASSSSIGVAARVSLPLSTTGELRVYHVNDDESLIPLGGASFRLGQDGQFVGTLFAPAGGWREGKTRVEIQLGNLSQVRAHTDLVIVQRGLAPGPEPAVRMPVSSGVVIDRDRGSRQSRSVSAGQRFLVRGTFPLRRQPGVIQGPHLLGELHKVTEEGRPVIVDSNTTISFPDGDDRHWYEIELTAPSTPGTYRLVLRPIIEQGAKEIEAEAIMLEVADPST